ncbi:MAG: hypothetical protein WBI07_17900, partial [Mobilitalea sp.]
FTGLDYYNFILSVEKEIASNPTNLTEKINAIRTKAFNKQNLTILFAGNTSAQDKFASSMKDFTSKLPDKTYAKAEYSLPIPSSREALAINSTVAYVVVNGSLLENNVPISGKSDIILSLLNNLMLTPEIRLKGGAYGVAAFASDNTYLTYTYRDSNFINSLATIGATDEFLKTVAPYVTEDTLESYKLSAYAAASQSTSEINEALIVLSNKLQGNTLQDKIDKLNQIKDTSVDDILVYAKYLENINNHLNYVIAAPMSDIEKNKDMFDSIIVLP